MAYLERDRLDGRAQRRTGIQDLSVPVATEHLRRGNRAQPQLFADMALDSGIDVRVGAHRARQLADCDDVPRSRQPLPIAPHLQSPERDLRTERRRLRVYPMSTADGRSVAELARAFGDGCFQARRRSRDPIHSAGHLQGKRGVDDVARREAVVHPCARRRANTLLDDVDERRDIVLRHLFALVDPVDIETGTLAHRTGVLFGNDAELSPRLDGQNLDFEPCTEARFVGEQTGDFGK